MNYDRRVYSYDRSRTAGTPETLSSAEVGKLPVGTIVSEWDGSYGNFLIVVAQGKLFPTAMLAERADDRDYDGDPVSGWGSQKFAVVAKGKGKVPTKATAYRQINMWVDGLKK